MVPSAATSGRLSELARVFLKLGTISVGGPAAHIALMRQEVVQRRHWVTDQEFLDLVGATNLIPGPNSTEMAIHVGRVRAGWRGLIVAGVCFILPAVLIVGTLAAVYVRFGTLPEMRALFYGIKPAIVAIILLALWQLGRAAVRSAWHVALAFTALAGTLLGLHELLLLALCGLAGGAVRWTTPRKAERIGGVVLWPGLLASTGASAATAAAVTSGQLFVVFLKAGALLFGSGYVLLAFLRADLVDRLGWLTEPQLLDAIAVGQMTPGPVFTTATFVGYLLAGPSGALVATIAIFLPAFVYVALSGPIIPRLRRSVVAAGVLDGVNIASLALMAAVTWPLARTGVVDVVTAAIAATSLALLVSGRVSSTWLLAGGAIVGLAKSIAG